MIIVEGPDGAGKTTLVNELVERFGFEIGERGTKDRSKLYDVTVPDTYRAIRYEFSPELGEYPDKIWDRLFWSELVYAPATGREKEFTDTDIKLIKNVLAAMRVPTIICMPPLEVVKTNIEQADQMKGVNENIEDIYRRYHKLIAMNFTAGWMRYDYSGRHVGMVHDIAVIASYIAGYEQQRRERIKRKARV